MTSLFFGMTDRSYHYDRTVGRAEFAGTGFRLPMDIALGSGGRIYIVSRGSDFRSESVRVTMLNLDEDYIGEFSQGGEGDGELTWPSSIALDSAENVYISDDWLNRISIFDRDGEFLGKWGVAGSGDGEIYKPSGLRFDKEDNLYVVDGGNNRVQVFTKEGKLLSKWGEAGSGESQFNLPWGLTIDDRGDVYVADWRNDRIQKFTGDGRFLAEFGGSGGDIGRDPLAGTGYRVPIDPALPPGGGFNRPTGIAVDKYGDIYVADWGNDRVQALTPDGRSITTFTGDAGLSKWGKEKLYSNPDMVKQMDLCLDTEPWRRLWAPIAIAIDPEGRIIIVDSYRNRLQVYQKDNY